MVLQDKCTENDKITVLSWVVRYVHGKIVKKGIVCDQK